MKSPPPFTLVERDRDGSIVSITPLIFIRLANLGPGARNKRTLRRDGGDSV